MTLEQRIARLDLLITRLRKCRRLIHSDEQITDEEFTALTETRDSLIVLLDKE